MYVCMYVCMYTVYVSTEHCVTHDIYINYIYINHVYSGVSHISQVVNVVNIISYADTNMSQSSTVHV